MALDAVLTPRQDIQPGELLFASDFDGTKFLTSESGEGILTVSEAYAEGIRDLLGAPAVAQFLDQGGHQHRTPAEIVADLCPDMAISEIESQARLLTAAKIAILTEQIGKPLSDGVLWPRPTDGFVSMWENLGWSDQRDTSVTTADLSAGHIPFIKRTYDVHGLQHPDFVVTDDFLVDELDLGDVPLEDRAKPSPLLLEVANALWMAQLGASATATNERLQRANTIYVGDSLEKDGGMAEKYGATFVLLNPEASVENWEEVTEWLNMARLTVRGATV